MRSPYFIVVLSAPSGAGKTSIAHGLMRLRKDVGFSVSATTRAPRQGERDGRDYHFISRKRFMALKSQGKFLEYARYGGEWYGTLKSEIKRIHDLGRHVLLDIDVQGARRVRKAYPPPMSVNIFVLPPTPTALLRRLRRRRSESLESLRRRVEIATSELTEAMSFEYSVVNDRLSDAVADVSMIVDAEEHRAIRNRALGKQLRGMASFLRHQARLIQARINKKRKVEA